MARTSNRLQQLQKALIRGLGVPCPELNKMVLFAIKIKELHFVFTLQNTENATHPMLEKRNLLHGQVQQIRSGNRVVEPRLEVFPELGDKVRRNIVFPFIQRAHSRKFSLDRPGHILRLYRNGLNRQREIPQERTVLLRKDKITHGLVLSSELDSRFFEETFNVLVQRTLVETAETRQSLFHGSITKILHDVYDKIRFRSHVSF